MTRCLSSDGFNMGRYRNLLKELICTRVWGTACSLGKVLAPFLPCLHPPLPPPRCTTPQSWKGQKVRGFGPEMDKHHQAPRMKPSSGPGSGRQLLWRIEISLVASDHMEPAMTILKNKPCSSVIRQRKSPKTPQSWLLSVKKHLVYTIVIVFCMLSRWIRMITHIEASTSSKKRNRWHRWLSWWLIICASVKWRVLILFPIHRGYWLSLPSKLPNTNTTSNTSNLKTPINST